MQCLNISTLKAPSTVRSVGTDVAVESDLYNKFWSKKRMRQLQTSRVIGRSR